MGALGERFMFYRVTVDDEELQALRRLENRGSEATMRKELAAAVNKFFDGFSPQEPRQLEAREKQALVKLARFAVAARSPIERDGRTRIVRALPEKGISRSAHRRAGQSSQGL